MLFNELNEENFLIFAIKNYENPQAVTREDFDKDLSRFRYIKRLLKRYKTTGDLKVHLLVNHFNMSFQSIFSGKTFLAGVALISVRHAMNVCHVNFRVLL